MRLNRTACLQVLAIFCSTWTLGSSGETAAPVSAPPPTLTNIKQIWDVSGPAASQAQRIRTEVVIYYFDAGWNCAFGESQGRITYLPIGDAPMSLKAGQRVAIEGLVVPSLVRFEWDKTVVRVLAEDALPQPLEFRDLSRLPADANGRLVLLEGSVGPIRFLDAAHVQLPLLCGKMQANVIVQTPTNGFAALQEGDYARLKGVLTFKSDTSGNAVEVALWVARGADVVLTGSLSADSRFAIPATPVENLFEEGLPPNQMIRVTGSMRKQEPGKWLVLWDDTGQIVVESRQTQLLRFGDRVEAIGFPSAIGVQASLRDAVYRVSRAPAQPNLGAPADSPRETLHLAAQIQSLNPEQARRSPHATLRAVLTWAHPDTPFAYVEDASGALRVIGPGWQDSNCVPGTIVLVSGTVTPGDYVPVLTNAVIRRAGWRGFDQAQPLTLEQATISGEDGQWVEMSGFVREITHDKGLMRLELTTSRGEFRAWTPASPAVDSMAGTVVTIDGVCSVVANSRQQRTSIELWVPSSLFIKTEGTPSKDIFASNARPLASLRRFSSQREDLNRRVKTTGTVVLHQPRRFLYLQDGADSLFALSRQEGDLHPGDRVEVAGFPGSERGRFLLREAVFRRISAGVEPAPVSITGLTATNLEMSGLLVQAEGILLNAAAKDEHVRLLIRSSQTTFEAALEAPNLAPGEGSIPAIGSRLALRGVYDVQNDEYGWPNSFLVLLRSWDDVTVLARPPWWTLPRLLKALGLVFLALATSIVWTALISRKNRALKHAQARLQAVNEELEAFSYSVSHDLRAPLRSIDGFSRALLEDSLDKLDQEARENLGTIRAATQRMGALIDDLLRLAKITRAEIRRTSFDLGELAEQVAAQLQDQNPGRKVELVIRRGLIVRADVNLTRVALDNLLGNAWKFTSKQPLARIEFGQAPHPDGPAYYVRDNGVGFDMAWAKQLFGAFQRLHSNADFPGTGIGLATVRRIIERHGGRIWFDSQVGQGATFHFTLPDGG